MKREDLLVAGGLRGGSTELTWRDRQTVGVSPKRPHPGVPRVHVVANSEPSPSTPDRGLGRGLSIHATRHFVSICDGTGSDAFSLRGPVTLCLQLRLREVR